MSRRIRVGVVSDTHGLLRPEAVAFVQGSDFIVHAGDIGEPEVLDALNALAPVTAVRGNNDRGEWARSIPETDVVKVDEVFIYVVHDIAELDVDPAAAGFHVVVSGHSHRPSIEERGGVLYLNPGSCGPRRFSLPISAADLTIRGKRVEARLAELPVKATHAR